MTETSPDPYTSKWLPRTRRALAPSGRITELALLLAAETGREQDHWIQRLRGILDGDVTAPPALVFRIDQFLGRPAPPDPDPSPDLPLT